MKIGINASFTRKLRNGIGEVTLNYLRTLSKNNTTDEFILYLEEDFVLDLPNNFTKKIFLPFYKRDDLIRKVLWEKFMLPKRIEEDGCESFISLYQCPMILSKEIKHTMVAHDIIPELFPEYNNNWRKKYYWHLTKKAVKKADKIVAVSHNTKKDLVKYLRIDENKIIVRHIDVDSIYKKEITEFDSQAVLKKYNLTSGYIYSGGGLDKRKNIDKLIYAYKLILDKNKNIPDLVISGKLMPELAPLIIDVEKIIKDLKIEDKVKILGFVPQENLPALYKNACLFVYPSLYEGFGMPLLEAMSVGTPVATSDKSSLGEIIKDAGILFDPENVEDVAQKIEEALSNEDLRKQNAIKAREYSKDFSWEKFSDF